MQQVGTLARLLNLKCCEVESWLLPSSWVVCLLVQGGWGVLEAAVYVALVSAAVTEVAKVFSGISSGGEGF